MISVFCVPRVTTQHDVCSLGGDLDEKGGARGQKVLGIFEYLMNYVLIPTMNTLAVGTSHWLKKSCVPAFRKHHDNIISMM